MKIRHDPLIISSVLFTIALLIPLPGAVGNVWTGPRRMLDIAGHMGAPNYYAEIGFICLTVIAVGLIVIWAAYINGARWTWFVLFLIAFAWALPVFVLAEFHWRNMMPIAQWPPY